MSPSATRSDMSERTEQQSYSDLRGQLIILGIFRFSEALAWTTIFPYVYFMMLSFLPDSPARDGNAAFFASLTVALFTFGEFLMGIAWAKISDHIGRKPTLLIGVIAGSASAAAFGGSKSLWMALSARAVGGLLNPNVGVVSTFVGELVKRKSDQGKAFSVVPFLRGLGLVGPVIGGHLADPVKTLPSFFQNGTVWENYPYLLPNLVVVCFIMSSGILGFLFLEEVHPQYRYRYDVGLEITRWVGRGISKVSGQAKLKGYASVSAAEDPMQLSDIAGVDGANEAVEGESASSKQAEHAELSLPLSPESALPPLRSTYSSQVLFQILAVSILAFHKVSSDVIIPTFLATPSRPTTDDASENGRGLFKFSAGFGMESPSISNILLSQAVISIVVQVLVVPKIIKKWSALRSFRWAMFMFPWMYCLTPFTARLPRPLSVIMILLDLWLKGLLVGVGYVCSAILLTNTTPSPKYLATVNGAAASWSCLARSVGAGISGSMFRLGLAEGYIGLPFWTLALLAGLGAGISWILRDEP